MKKPDKKDEKHEFGDFEREIIQGLLSGKPLGGKDGVLTDLISYVVERAMDAELGDHLMMEASALDEARIEGGSKGPGSNKRNGKQTKTVRTDFGPAQLTTSRDRTGTYESNIVPKRSRSLASGMSLQILSLYARGTSQRDISKHLDELFGTTLSPSSISDVVEEVWDEVKEWQQRPLQSFYIAVFMDAIHFKVRLEGRSVSVAVYLFYGVDAEGNRELLSLHTGHGAEQAAVWSNQLVDLRNRGVEDVLVFISDGLTGLNEVIQHHFPNSQQQRCIVHKVRNSMIAVPYKDRKAVARSLRLIYTSIDAQSARLALDDFMDMWPQYGYVAKIWLEDWDELIAFMDYGPEMRRLIYTTNALENVNRQIRKNTKSKGSWTTLKSLNIQLYLIIKYSKDSLNRKVFNFTAIQQELIEVHGQRYFRWANN